MANFDFHDKTFLLLDNTAQGTVNRQTVFKYQQEGNLVTADYHGGPIRYGKIIATLDQDKLNMLYQCVTTAGILKAGKALAHVSLNHHGKLALSLNWEWLDGGNESGVSTYIEQ